MSKIPTAEETLNKHFGAYDNFFLPHEKKIAIDAMNEHTKIYVEAALKAVIDASPIKGAGGLYFPSEDSILNAYPLNQIV